MSLGGSSVDTGKRPQFNGGFFAYLVVCGALSIFFLLYLNRVFASFVSWAIRTWTWHQYRVYIDIKALQISLLGGRIFFTGFRYHGNNETILIQNGHITWSYWLRRVRDVGVGKKKEKGTGEATGAHHNGLDPSRLPCRVNVSVLGVEWFVYNRSPAYDSVLAGLTDDGDTDDEPSIGAWQEADDAPSKLRRRRSKRPEGFGGLPGGQSSQDGVARHMDASSPSSGSSNDGAGDPDSRGREDELPLLLRLFPINVECQTAGLVMGNENTKAVLIVKADGVSGDIDASDTETPDPYRQVFRLKFKHPVIEMRDNQDYKESLADRATREKSVAQQSDPVQTKSYFRRQRRRVMGQIRGLVPYWRKSVESFSSDLRNGPTPHPFGGPQPPGLNHWQGLSRYLNDSEDQKALWESVEYAALPTVLDSPEASMTILWDVVSNVSPKPTRNDHVEKAVDNVNGEDPPAWAISLSIKGGSVNYGPWADRQRAELQRTFFPALSKDASPATRLPVGAARVPTQFKLYVELEEEATIRIPTREESKNWKWKGKEPEPKTARVREKRKFRGLYKKSGQAPQTLQRPYGWLDIKVAANTTASYSMDMVAGASGYSNSLLVDLPKTEISSSINHELLWRSGPQRISCDLSTPLRWNALRQWRFNVASEDLELFLLRDHIFLLIDLVDDWASGPPAEYLVFTPFKYHLDLQLQNVKLYLNVNDANIINNPTDMEGNTYIMIGSPLLRSTTCIPIDEYRPSKNAIPFDVRADTASVGLHVPPWNTQATFVPSMDIGHLADLVVDGCYHYNATSSPANTDTLVLDVSGQSPTACLHGFVIRYGLKLKDNYFGDDIHFKTLEEYQETLKLKETNPDAELASRPPHKQSNDLDVILNVRADDPKVQLPGNLYASSRHTHIEAASLSCDLRFTNYYMDMDLVLTPLSLSPGSADGGTETPISAASSTQLFIDGVNVYGHRLFGLPPSEPTYLCNWDISVGHVTGECSADFLSTLINGGKAFGFSFDDDENALISYSSVIFYDVTFLRAFVQSVNIWLHVDEAAFLLSTREIDVKYNDWARSHYSRRANIRIPDVQLSCVNSESASRSKSRSHHRPVETDAFVQTSVHLAIVGRKFDFSNERKLQQELVRREDQRTQRTGFLCLRGLLGPLTPDPVHPPAQCYPDVPQPTTLEHLHGDQSSLASSRRSGRSRDLRRKSSFLSFSSSSQASVVRAQSSKHSSSVKAKRPDYLQPFAPVDQRPGRAGRTALHDREVSASTGRHSAFHSAADDIDRQDAGHNTVAFSSQYFAPYFPLESVKPDTFEARIPNNEDDERAEDDPDDLYGSVDFNLEDIDTDILDQECASSSILVELPTGLTAFFNPTSLRAIAALLSALQPSGPEDIIDALQIDSVEEILGMQKAQKMKGRFKDVFVRVPRANVRFINVSDPDTLEDPQEEQDQYDFSVTKLALASRTESRWLDSFNSESMTTHTSFHLRLKSAELSAAERLHSLDGPQAAALAQIEHVMVSMGSKDLTYLDVDIGSIQGDISSRKLEYLVNLIHRTNLLVADLGGVFAETTSRERRLIGYLAHRLTKDGASAPDPTFLIRPSAVLRFARQHLRTFDSWKLAMRLRQMWSTLDPYLKEQLELDCSGPLAHVADDTIRQNTLASFQQWRSWDLRDASASVLLNKIFGPSEDRPMRSSDEGPTLAVVKVKETQLALDPGPKQNEIIFLDITVRFETSDASREEGEPVGDAPNGSLTVLNICCADSSVSLNWELCELADVALRLYDRMQAKQNPRPAKTLAPPSPTAARQERTIHCVLSLDQFAMALETVNIHASSLGNGMKASLLLKTGSDNVSDTNFIISCDSVRSRLLSKAQVLAKFLLSKPSVLISHELQASTTTDKHTIKATASSRELSVVVKQDPVVLSEVLDALIRDEVAQVYRLKNHLPSSPVPPSPSKTIIDRLSAFRVNIAMFMDQYTISVPLLRSLTYTVSGTVTRAAMAANFGREIIFDFDIKENLHEMQITVNNMPRSISLLQIPPTNGRIASRTDDGEHSITVFASVELVQLDAAAVYSLLTALNRPEMSSALNDLQQQGRIIQKRITNMFGADDRPVLQPGPEKEADVLAYAVHLSFAGLEVFGSCPLKSSLAPMAHISFCLDSVHLEMANRVEPDGPVLAHPEMHINLRQVAFEIQRGTPDSLGSCGNLTFSALVTTTSRPTDDGRPMRWFNAKSDGFEVSLSPDTVSTAIDILGFMGDKFKDLDTSRELEYLRKISQTKPRIIINDQEEQQEPDIVHTFLSSMTYTFEMRDIKVSWLVTKPYEEPSLGKDDLVLSLERIEFGTRTKNSARLTIENLQLQMVSPLQDRKSRSPNSALLPEVIFNIAYVSTPDARRLAFQAVGKSLDLRLNSGFITPGANLKNSIALSAKNVQQASQNWNPVISATSPPRTSGKTEEPRQNTILGSRRLESLLVDADFAGAVVCLASKRDPNDLGSADKFGQRGMSGKYGQFTQEDSGSTVWRTPGLACKMGYSDNGKDDPSLYAEVKVEASSNILYPSVVPLIMDITNTVKEVVSGKGDDKTDVQPEEVPAGAKVGDDDNFLTADPSAVLGRVKLNLGVRIYKQEFSLSCQPIARVAATASFEHVYLTANTVQSAEQGKFLAISAASRNLRASVQHVYSRESTGCFEVESIVLSLMNSKHVSGISGVSAILKVSPMKVSVNVKQLQDFLLFREIWIPREIRQGSSAPVAKLVTETSQGHLVQRYQQVAATAAFPWTATVSITALEINVDLGQALGKSVFAITEFWVSSKKTSDWEQNLCLGFQKIGVDSTGRMSGFVALQNFQLRTLIKWPEREQALNETPLVQASIGFGQLRVKAAFDYQAFLVADITSLEFIMYNVRNSLEGAGDRLVAIFEGEAVQIFGTTTTAAQVVAMSQAFQRLFQEKRASYETSLKEIERFMKRKSGSTPAVVPRVSLGASGDGDALLKSPILLDTDVVVTLKALNLGVFPNTFSDHQVFKMEALNAQARFAASIVERRIHSILGLTLGQLRIGLAGVGHRGAPKALSELSVDDVVSSATGSRGGTVLKVPRVEAMMQTWQSPDSKHIDYIFKSAFEGKVEVGWNYSRISYIRGMWANHAKALAQTWGRELPPVTAIRVTGVPELEGEEGGEGPEQQTKITAEVNVPQSKYEYTALEPPIIETPQLRDMGEATPPLEWIGLQRDRLPNLTHQIVIVALLELASEVEDAYSSILGSS